MYFSKIQINPQLRKTKAALANPHLLHGMMTKAVPPDQQTTDAGRVLWRVDATDTGVVLYAVTPVEPRFDHVVEQLGWPSAPAQTTDYGRLLDSLCVGQRFAFKVTLNPVNTVSDARGKPKRVPHVSVKHQMRWFLDRAEQWGFAIVPAATDVQPADGDEQSEAAAFQLANVNIVKREDLRFSKNPDDRRSARIVHRTAVFEGLLEVTDAQKLRHALAHGMGRAKAYGCGLMTLARPVPA